MVFKFFKYIRQWFWRGSDCTIGTNSKIQPQMSLWNWLINGRNNFTIHTNEERSITGNGNAKSCFELIREINTCKLKKKIYFWRSFAIWNYCAPPHTWYSMIYSIHNLKYLWFLSDFHSWLCNGLLCLAKWTVFPPLNQFIYPYFLVVALYTIRSNYKKKGIK